MVFRCLKSLMSLASIILWPPSHTKSEAMGVQFKIPRQLQEKTDGEIHIEVRGSNVYECIADLIRRYPGLKGRILDGEGRILLKWMVYINNKCVIPSNELSYAVKDGDLITVLPVVAGG